VWRRATLRIADQRGICPDRMSPRWHDANVKYAPPLRIGLSAERRSRIDEALKLKVRAHDGVLVPLSEVVQAVQVQRDYPIYHKDLLPWCMCSRHGGQAG